MNRQNYGYQNNQVQINNQYPKKYETVKNINIHQKQIQTQNHNANAIKINNQNKYNYPTKKQFNYINKNLEVNKTQENVISNNDNFNTKQNEISENKSPFININNNIEQNYNINNKTEIPNPDLMNQSPFPISNPSPFDLQKVNSSFVQTNNNALYNEFLPKSKMNNSYIIKENPLYEKRRFNLNEARKEISSDALDNLFDFNIGKELEPEPDIMIDNNK